MRALTLTQPWCGLVASGIKLVENRPRSMIKREDFGKPFALHASREIDDDVYDRIEEMDPALRLLPSCMTSTSLAAVTAPSWYRLSRITSAVIAVATIERAVVLLREPLMAGVIERMADYHTGDSVDLGDQRRWYFGPIGYVLRDVRSLAEPVPCKGQLGFWTLPVDVTSRVEEQLR